MTASGVHSRWALLTAFLGAVIVHAVFVAAGFAPSWNGGSWDLLWDPDSYMRLLQVRQLLETGAWHDKILHGVGPGAGMDMHWTRPLDVLLIAGAWLGAPFVGADAALWGWSMMFGPATHLALLLLLSWATRDFLDDRGYLALALLASVQWGIVTTATVGQVDHHGLTLLGHAAGLACLLRALSGAAGRRLVLAGVAAGLAVWINVEALITVLATLTALSLLWLVEAGPWLRRTAVYLASLGAALAVAVAVEYPVAQWTSFHDDQHSAMHVIGAVVLLAATLAVLAVAGRLPRHWSLRLGLGLAAAVLAGGVLHLAFPQVGLAPHQWAGDIVIDVLEIQRDERPYLPYSPLAIHSMMIDLAPLLIAAPAVAAMIWRGDDRRRRRALVYAGFMVVGTTFGMWRYRGLGFLQLAFLPPLVEALWWLAARVRSQGRAAVAVTVAVASTWHWGVAFAYDAGRDGLDLLAAGRIMTPRCGYERLAPHLAALRAVGGRGTALTYVYAGPEVRLRSGWPVLDAPYHRNTLGMEQATTLAFGDPDETVIRQLARDADLGLVVFCRRELPWMVYYPYAMAHPESLLARLMRDDPPAWLRRVALPADLGREFLVYQRVDEPR